MGQKKKMIMSKDQPDPYSTDTPTLIKAMEILAKDIQSEDGAANAAISEAAIRLSTLSLTIDLLREEIADLQKEKKKD